MKNRFSVIAASCVLILGILACNAPAGQAPNQPDYVATITAQAGLIPQAGSQSTSTPTTGQVPTASEIAATNCRAGPGTAYNVVTNLAAGQTEVVVGKDLPDNYWIVNNPNGTGTCWVWGQNVTVTGDTSGLPQVAPPAVATPRPTKTPKPTSTTEPAPAAPQGFGGKLLACTLTKSSLAGDNLAYTAALHWSLVPNAKGYRIYQGSTMLFEEDPTADGVGWDGSVANTTTSNGISFGIEAFNNAGSSPRIDVSLKCP